MRKHGGIWFIKLGRVRRVAVGFMLGWFLALALLTQVQRGLEKRFCLTAQYDLIQSR